MNNPYETLGVEPDATDDEIKRAHRKAAQQSHPDREGGDTNRFQEVTAAYRVLRNPERRAEYDRTGKVNDGPTHDLVTQKLVEMFNHIIDNNEFQCDIIGKCRSMVASAIQHCQSEASKADAKYIKLNKQLDRVTAKGDNLFRNLIESKMTVLQNQADHFNREREIMIRVREAIEEYQDNDPKSASSGVTWGNIDIRV